jgi:hypothetical protein
MPAPSGIDETLELEAVYLPAPIPRSLAVLTAMGAIFDKVYFPGVYLPKEGFDVGALDKEITRLKALPQDDSGLLFGEERGLLLGILDLTKHAKTLAGFCEFTGDSDDVFCDKSPPPQQLVQAVHDTIHGPPRKGATLMFTSGSCKGLPGGNETVNAAMNDPARPWHKRAIDALKIIPQVGGAFLVGGGAAALTKAITLSAAQFFVEVAAKGDKEEVLKRSGLTYLLHLRRYHDSRS